MCLNMHGAGMLAVGLVAVVVTVGGVSGTQEEHSPGEQCNGKHCGRATRREGGKSRPRCVLFTSFVTRLFAVVVTRLHRDRFFS